MALVLSSPQRFLIDWKGTGRVVSAEVLLVSPEEVAGNYPFLQGQRIPSRMKLYIEEAVYSDWFLVEMEVTKTDAPKNSPSRQANHRFRRTLAHALRDELEDRYEKKMSEVQRKRFFNRLAHTVMEFLKKEGN